MIPEMWAIKVDNNNARMLVDYFNKGCNDKKYTIKNCTNSIFHYPNYETKNGFSAGYHLDSSKYTDYLFVDTEFFEKNILQDNKIDNYELY